VGEDGKDIDVVLDVCSIEEVGVDGEVDEMGDCPGSGGGNGNLDDSLAECKNGVGVSAPVNSGHFGNVRIVVVSSVGVDTIFAGLISK